MAVRKFTNIFVLLLVLMVGSRDTLFLVCFTLKNVRTDRQQAVAAPKCQPSEDEPPDHQGCRIHSMDFYLELHVSGAVSVSKKDEILDQGRDSLYFPGLPLALLFDARALIGRTDGA